VGDDEARARATLLEMQARLSQGAHIVLGVAELATAAQVRTAFLELTKQYHPARFGRMSTDLQRMSNEVFLGIKSAHESMLRTLGVSAKPNRAAGSGSMPPVIEQTQRGYGAEPPVRRATPPSGYAAQPGRATPPSGYAAQPGRATPPGGHAAQSSRATPPSGSAAQSPRATPPSGYAAQPVRTTPPSGYAAQPGPASGPAARPAAPATPAVARTVTPSTRPIAPSAAHSPARGPDPLNPDTIRHAGAPAAFDEQTALADCHGLLRSRNWSAARQALHALAARVPQSRQYRALLCYARGRETLHAGRADDAALEFQRAVQLDPDLAIAKQALAEVQRRK
jgi:hypothetical protein